MNQVSKVEAARPPRMGLVPETMQEAMHLANMMATSKLVPMALQKAPADCLMVIMQAVRWQMDPFAVAQECSVIRGRLMYSGKLCGAVINARGNLTQRLAFDYAGQGTDRTITVRGQIHGEPEIRQVEVKFRDAKTEAEVWKTQPDQQLAYHATRVWARRHCPELMLGVYAPEEFGHNPLPPANELYDPVADAVAEATLNPPATDSAYDPETGELDDTFRKSAEDAARRGDEAIKQFFMQATPYQKKLLRKWEADLMALSPDAKATTA